MTTAPETPADDIAALKAALAAERALRAFHGMVERSRYAKELGFDWVSVSEHYYSPHILTPSLPIAAAYIAQHVHDIKIALLGPIVPQSNPVLLAEENGYARQHGRGAADRRHVARYLERNDDLRPQSCGVARAH